MQKQAILKLDKIIIYSVGLLGGSIGLGLKRSGYKGKIIGLSSSSGLEVAMSLGCIDEGYPYSKLCDVIGDADAIFLCSPIAVILDTIENLGKLELPDNLIITDIGSTKGRISELARKTLPDHVHFIGGHPMAGSEKRGPSASNPYLFQNAVYVLSPLSRKPADIDFKFGSFLSHYLGCRSIFLDPETHDIIAATVSHIPHILAVALVNLAQEIENQTPGTIELAAGGFRDLTRIASAPFKMWHDIFITNKVTINLLLDKMIKRLSILKEDLNEDNLESSFVNAAETRSGMPHHNKGFLTPLYEVLVMVEDKPGVIASISGMLYKKDINIKDIEVIKIREGEGGILRLAFESYDTACNAVEILNNNGYPARERE